jgi:hypothetical protein
MTLTARWEIIFEALELSLFLPLFFFEVIACEVNP